MTPGRPASRRPLSRRTVVVGALGAAGVAAVGAEHAPAQAATKLPAPNDSCIDHIVVLMM